VSSPFTAELVSLCDLEVEFGEFCCSSRRERWLAFQAGGLHGPLSDPDPFLGQTGLAPAV